MCRQIKPVEEFSRSKITRDKRYPRCRECRKWEARRRKYGVGQEWFEARLKSQGGRCAICGTDDPAPTAYGREGWHIDHDHRTGKLRGILCVRCNYVVGVAETPGLLEKALTYLARHVLD